MGRGGLRQREGKRRSLMGWGWRAGGGWLRVAGVEDTPSRGHMPPRSLPGAWPPPVLGTSPLLWTSSDCRVLVNIPPADPETPLLEEERALEQICRNRIDNGERLHALLSTGCICPAECALPPPGARHTHTWTTTDHPLDNGHLSESSWPALGCRYPASCLLRHSPAPGPLALLPLCPELPVT